MAVTEGSTGALGKSEKEMYLHLEGSLEEMARAEVFRWGWVWREDEGHSGQKNLPL